MQLADVREQAVRDAIARAGAEFSTVAIADDPQLREAHPEWRAARNFRAVIGKFLKRLVDDAGDPYLIEIAVGTGQGSRWRFRYGNRSAGIGSVTATQPQAERKALGSGAANYGPQSSGDAEFTARMRWHQSWYRAARLGVPCGTGPQAGSNAQYGNMLRREDARRGLNFLSPQIFEVALQRIAEGAEHIEPFRLLHNMLSSQPMCFNLFAPLDFDRRLAARVLRRLLPCNVASVERVTLELAPAPKREYLDDGTSFDAAVEFTCDDGRRGIVGIETKLTDDFSLRAYDRPAYRRLLERPGSPWRVDEYVRLRSSRFNQLWRDHLLALAMRERRGSPFAQCFFMLVRHPEDRACAQTIAAYQKLLVPGDMTFIDCPLDRLVQVVEQSAGTEEYRRWISNFRERYLSLEVSRPGQKPSEHTRCNAERASFGQNDAASTIIDWASRASITQKFAVARAALAHTFPEAFRFLCFPDENPQTGLWWHTAVNAHLYHADCFVAYVRFVTGGLSLSARYNHLICAGTRDDHGRLFPHQIQHLIQKHGGFGGGWAQERPDGVVVRRGASDAFFIDLLGAARRVGKAETSTSE